MKIFISRNGERHGPYSISDVQEMLGSGKLFQMDLAWYEGLDEWAPLFKLPDLTGNAAPPPRTAPSAPSLQQQKELSGYSESKIKRIIKCILGGLFMFDGFSFIGGGVKLFSLNHLGGSALALLGVYLLAGGIWWLIGRGEQHWVPMPARLALIFSLVLAFVFGLILTVIYNGGYIPHIFEITGCVFLTFGVPAIICACVALNRLKRLPCTFRGKGRSDVALALSVIALIYVIIQGFNELGEKPSEPEEALVKAVPAGHISPPEQQAESTISDNILGAAWNAREYGQWAGRWTRRGNTNVFDVRLKDGSKGGIKTFYAVVTRDDYKVRIVSHNSSDGRDSVYDGEISRDGSSISGTYMCAGGGPYRWSAEILRRTQRTAPEGVLFLRTPQSIVTDDGVNGLIPGTSVKLIESKGDVIVIGVGDSRLEVTQGDVTTDMDEAEWLLSMDTQGQAMLAERGRRDRHVYNNAKREAWEKHEASQRQRTTEYTSSGFFFDPNPLHRGAYNRTGGIHSRMPDVSPEQARAVSAYILQNIQPDYSQPVRYPGDEFKNPSKEMKAIQRLNEAQRAIIDEQIREIEKREGPNSKSIDYLRWKQRNLRDR